MSRFFIAFCLAVAVSTGAGTAGAGEAARKDYVDALKTSWTNSAAYTLESSDITYWNLGISSAVVHASSASNPHQVTAAQTGAATLAQVTQTVASAISSYTPTRLYSLSPTALKWIDGDGDRWRVDVIATTNATQLLMYESGFNQTVILTKIPVEGVFQYSGMDPYGRVYAFGDMYEDGLWYADAWYPEFEEAEWRLCDPQDWNTWPKTFGDEVTTTGGWVDVIVTYTSVTSKWDEVANISITNGLVASASISMIWTGTQAAYNSYTNAYGAFTNTLYFIKE